MSKTRCVVVGSASLSCEVVEQLVEPIVKINVFYDLTLSQNFHSAEESPRASDRTKPVCGVGVRVVYVEHVKER